ncbi:MAG: tetratricopeptide repeat protein [Duncaniella sp.]|nr:tetratricopeptide repeat protein [Duncaniella sp.]
MKKNTAASRNYQAFITRYNVYFNGDEHFKETLKQMEQEYVDDYSILIPMHPVEAYTREDAPKPTGSFDRSIKKAQKAIQLHSIAKRPRRKPGHLRDPEYNKWMKRSEYNPFIHNAWMLLGKSRYYNGDFEDASVIFNYVATHFIWIPETVTEAKLWQAKCYCAMDWLFEAEHILVKIKLEQLANATLKELYNYDYADLHIRSNELSKAIPYLNETIHYASGVQKPRLNFLLGQLYEAIGDKKKSYQAYAQAQKGISTSYLTKFKARIRQSNVFTGKDVDSEIKDLKKLARYGRNKEYLDQILYAIGNLYLSKRDTLRAIESYHKAIDESSHGGIEKAIAQLALGKLYYNSRRYDLAQPLYAEAIATLPESYQGINDIQRRSDVLDELAVYSRNVVLNDSLLSLSAMPENQRLSVIDKIISQLKKEEKRTAESAKREEYLANQPTMINAFERKGATIPQSYSLNNDKSWYFYNEALRSAGRTDFQRRWGARKLEDDWRRHDKKHFSFSEFDDSGEDEILTDSEEKSPEKPENVRLEARRNDPHYPEYYLKQIPSTEVEINIAREVIQEGLYNSGLILKDRLEDYSAAHSEWSRLLAEYPYNVYRLEVYYNEYLMNLRGNDTLEAGKWRKMILDEFPQSKEGMAMRDPHYIDNLRRMDIVQDSIYRKAYARYLAGENESVRNIYEHVAEKYPMSTLMSKFMFLNALTFVSENNPEAFKEALRKLLERYPDTELTPMASSYLKGVAQGRELQSDDGNPRSLVWSTKLSTSDETIAIDNDSPRFTFKTDEPHYLTLLFDITETPQNELLYEVARYNFTTYLTRDFDLEMMNFGNLGILLVKGFANHSEASKYLSKYQNSISSGLSMPVRPIIISRSDFDRLSVSGASFDDYDTSLQEHQQAEPAVDTSF